VRFLIVVVAASVWGGASERSVRIERTTPANDHLLTRICRRSSWWIPIAFSTARHSCEQRRLKKRRHKSTRLAVPVLQRSGAAHRSFSTPARLKNRGFDINIEATPSAIQCGALESCLM
jgi:hypothetical protein